MRVLFIGILSVILASCGSKGSNSTSGIQKDSATVFEQMREKYHQLAYACELVSRTYMKGYKGRSEDSSSGAGFTTKIMWDIAEEEIVSNSFSFIDDFEDELIITWDAKLILTDDSNLALNVVLDYEKKESQRKQRQAKRIAEGKYIIESPYIITNLEYRQKAHNFEIPSQQQLYPVGSDWVEVVDTVLENLRAYAHIKIKCLFNAHVKKGHEDDQIDYGRLFEETI